MWRAAIVLWAGCAQFDATFCCGGDADVAPRPSPVDAAAPRRGDASAPVDASIPIDAVVVDAGCGGFGQPCCGGTACDPVLSCNAGTCGYAPLVPMGTARGSFGIAIDGSGAIYAIGGTHGNSFLDSVESYAPAGAAWSSHASLPFPRGYLSAAAGSDGHLYVLGGETGSMGRIPTFQIYNPAADSWTGGPDMPTARAGLAVVAAFGLVYAIGGGDDNDFVSAVEVYIPTANLWSPRASLPVGRERLAAALGPDGHIYALGGWRVVSNNNVAFDEVDAYDPAGDSWARRASMPTQRWSLAAVEAGGLIYAIGGKHPNVGALANVEAYDPTMDAWTHKSDMPTARKGCGAVVAGDGRIYVIGGNDGNDNPLSLIEAYDPRTDTWYR